MKYSLKIILIINIEYLIILLQILQNNFMNKSSLGKWPINLDKILKSDGHYAGDLVSLDFKS